MADEITTPSDAGTTGEIQIGNTDSHVEPIEPTSEPVSGAGVESSEDTVTGLFDTDAADQTEIAETVEGFLDGRFADRESFEKAYSNLEAKLKERATALDDDTLRAAAKERGFLTEPPESYDGIHAVMKEAGINPAAEDDPSWGEFFDEAKAQGLSQDQMNWMVKFGGEWVNNSINQYISEYGPTVDREGQIAKLSEDWGDKTETRGKEVMQWASANVPREILTKPLIQTAAGMKALHKFMSEQRGAQPITDNSRKAGVTESELNDKVSALMQSEGYKQAHHPNHKAIHQQVDKLLAALVNTNQ